MLYTFRWTYLVCGLFYNVPFSFSIAGGWLKFRFSHFCNASWALHFVIPVNRKLLTNQLGFTMRFRCRHLLYETVVIPYGRFACSKNWFWLALLLFFLCFSAVMAMNQRSVPLARVTGFLSILCYPSFLIASTAFISFLLSCVVRRLCICAILPA